MGNGTSLDASLTLVSSYGNCDGVADKLWEFSWFNAIHSWLKRWPFCHIRGELHGDAENFFC